MTLSNQSYQQNLIYMNYRCKIPTYELSITIKKAIEGSG